jgi:acetyltransferase-like isoleucine patch superfamily enzyme
MVGFLSVITRILLWNQIVSKFRPQIGTVKIGAHTYGNPNIVSFRKEDVVIIGKFCSIADDALILAGGEHDYRMVSTFPLRSRLIAKKEVDVVSKGPIIIGNDVWIGSGVIILSGVEIGHGSVIGAGSIVTRNVPPYAIVTGVPAKISGFRFKQHQIKKLLEIAWWNWSLEKIISNSDYFYGDVEDFIARFTPK